MPDITDPLPAEIAVDLAELRSELDRTIPAKALDKNLLIATWNIRNFGSLTEKWASGPHDSPKRDLHAVRCIAEIISRFDVIALQEVRSNLKALRHTMKVLPPHWGLILTDATRGALGNQERMAFLFDTRKVLLSGLACELVIPPEQLEQIEDDKLRRQFARTPYAVGFRCLEKYFTLVSLHIIWGTSPQERIGELQAIANWLEDWSKDKFAWDHNLIALGDFNIEQEDDPLFQAFTSTGLGMPEELRKAARSIFDTPSQQVNKFFDQIAWFQGKGKGKPMELDYVNGGNFDFTKAGMNSRKMDLETLSWFLSDHLPLWAEFSVRT